MAIPRTFVLLCAALSAASAFRAPLKALHGSPRLFGTSGPIGSRRPTQLQVFRKEKPPKEPSAEDISRELAKHYRTLGVREDAEFDEISEQTDRLKEKYQGDVKKVKTIEIAKDRILELKLAQRLKGSCSHKRCRETRNLSSTDALWDANAGAGSLAISTGAVEYDTEREMYEKSQEARKRRMPTWMKYITKMYCPPTATERTRFAIYFGGSAVVRLGQPQRASRSRLSSRPSSPPVSPALSPGLVHRPAHAGRRQWAHVHACD
eukprot:scaffold1159_cov215-Pinguiococcus_pyrenoidosus.AAC.19